MIPVTKPFLPPKNEYDQLIDQIWQRNWLTNNGPLVNELELKLKANLNLEHLLFTTNGTIALQMAIKALDLKGEIITTPFSYVATTSSIVWEGCTPVFADIVSERLTIDPTKIEALISEKTSAILATHVYGIPCHVEEIEAIAKKNGLKVVYDAAHAFGTSYKGQSLLSYGDISTLSTHATKLFHTIEGGAVIANDPALLKRLAYLRNFGHDGADRFNGVGINGKNSEFHAAMGLANLPYIDNIIEKRKEDSAQYDAWLLDKGLMRPAIPADTLYNYSYYPIIFKTEQDCVKVFDALAKHEIFARRYFYPSLAKLDYIVKRQTTPVCDNIAPRVLCLPLYFNLTQSEIDLICRLILRTLKY
ncbi:DegT/DnrJ/EryC1/StrS family aminotransferase [Carboxylicivirga sediminis]|uniref:DegT/DnrJ/EryC1/StrS family aminotransferase n=1 Tax=Carboxylicivirga sediminis TaxID=2006564 RepID=A0A941F2S8_9BACT|nr:DegT/DnrJ/EryC1/StrS family aminotransferase [Carboxylicivirga sediminis]MBR8535746.1 DegT/DnrJ/EryC1/StrS family aminotransferase [Carboxylicivirga sediminis]